MRRKTQPKQGEATNYKRITSSQRPKVKQVEQINIKASKTPNDASLDATDNLNTRFSIDDFALLTLDVKGNIISWNNGAQKLTGYDKKEIKNKHYSILLAEEEEAYHLEQAKKKWVIEEYGLFRKKNHDLFRAKAIYSCITDTSSRAIAYTLIIRDEIPAQRYLAETVMHEVVDAVVITDANLENPGPKILYTNPQFTKMTGYSSDEIIGKTPRILQGPKTDRKVLEQLKEKLKTGLSFEGETVNYRKDGSEFFLKWNISPIRDRKGNISHFISIQRDITKRMRMEKELLDREEQFRLLAENSDDIVSLHRKDGSFLYCSPSMKRNLGYKPDEIIGKSPFDFFHPKEIAKGHLEFELLSINRQVSTHTFRMKHKNGTYVWLESKMQPVLEEDGTIKRIVAFSRNITQQKAAKNELKLQKAYFEQLFESSPEGVVILDKEDRIVNANKSFQELFLYSRKEILGKNINDLILPGEIATGEAKTTYKALGYDTHQIEAVRMRKDGSLVDVSIIGAPIEYDNKLVGVYGIYRDITLQKKDEYTVKKSLREKEVLLQEIHHRVKNNMQVISSLHNLQARQIKDKKTLAIFKESQNRVQAMALIHDQLYKSADLARINFGDYLKDLVHQLFSSIGRCEISYSVKSDPVSFNVNQAVPCGLIVNELVTNALKHAFKNGHPGNIEISLRDMDENNILLEVSDDGIGFPPDVDLKNISSSLGLQLVSGLVEQIKGSIKLLSKNETRFSILLPK